MSVRTLVGLGLKLDDVGGERRIGSLDPNRILSDLRDAGVSSRQRTWFSLQMLDRFDRVLLAHGDRDGKYEAILLVQCRTVGENPFLVIEALSGGPASRDQALLRRLLAYLILRLDTFPERPVAILALTRNPMLGHVMRNVAGAIGTAGFYPDPNATITSLATALLAHRMARAIGPTHRFAETSAALHAGGTETAVNGPMSAVIDLRAVDEVALMEKARRLFRDHVPRSAKKPSGATVISLPLNRQDEMPRLSAHVAARSLPAVPIGPASRA